MMIGNRRILLSVVDSTNRYARDLLGELPEEGTLVTAESQTAGRGRMDRQWMSATAQNVLASLILYPEREAEEWGGLPLLSGLAVCRAVRSLATIDAHLKWPNDVLVDNRKLCGILVESGRLGSRPWVIVGIGINVNQVRFEGSYRATPTSMALEAGRPFDTDEVLAAMCGELDRLYADWREEGNPPIIAAWKQASRMLGQGVVVDENGVPREGRAVDVANDGSLVVEFPDGSTERIFAGDVTLQKGTK
ncbi:MAG: biotin--[acetyl-CoA-carboxylase] ligase [Bacteroidetes bacterium]|nr:biotin--[acetyl-CoA-carboxylase] ligase [Bacteroidota bacterium]